MFFVGTSPKGTSLPLRIAGQRRRFLFLLLEGIAGPFQATLNFEAFVGEGKPRSLRLEPANLGVYVVAPALLKNVQQLRVDVSGFADKVRVFGVATRSLALLRMLLWASSHLRRRSPLVHLRYHFVGEHPAFSSLGVTSRRRRSAANRIGRHFRHVIDLAATEHALGESVVQSTQLGPLVSFVVPVFDTKPEHLNDLLASFRMQPRQLCELVLSDDGSRSQRTLTWLAKHRTAEGVKIVTNSDNKGIAAATNLGISHASGRWIGLVDHDDALAPYAVVRIAKALEKAPGCRFLYTDEVIADRNLCLVDYFLKPAWDPVLLSGVNYVNHLSLYERRRLTEIGGLRDGLQGSQDYDLLLRYTSGLATRQILHLPYPAYIWRRNGVSFSAQFRGTATAHARRALAERYGRPERPIVIDRALSEHLHRVRFDVARSQWPLVSVVIPSRDCFHLISRVLDGLTRLTDYPSLEIIVVDNGSEDPKVLAMYDSYRKGPMAFRARVALEPFNFSRSVNLGISMSKGRHVLLLNNDVEILEPNWLKEMVSCFDYPETGIVGAKLLYPNRSIQHVGVIAGLGGLAGHWFVGRDENFPGPMARLRVRQSMSVVTGACMLISRDCLNATGAFDENVFAIAYNDVDFCLRSINAGFRVVWTPFATLLHHESASRGSDETAENIERFRRDQQSLRDRHRTQCFEDRAFSPWYSKDKSEPAPVLLDQLPAPR
jgi:O-antigen biosynthesis protein